MKPIFFLLLFLWITPIQAAIQNVPLSSQAEINVTLYSGDIALIKEKRTTFLAEGSNKLLIKGVPSSILEDSLIFQIHPLEASVKLLEYNFQAPHVTQDVLLKHSVGDEVKILPSQLLPMPPKGKLLSIDGDEGIVESSGEIYILKKNRIAFLQLPYTLVSEPLITLKVMNAKEGDYSFYMGYLTKGFTWEGGYTIVLDASANYLDLDNWINIHNKSGMDIKKGHFLIAHIQAPEDHFYDIEKTISLSNNAVKNISWAKAQKLKPTKSFRIYPKNNLTENEEGVVIKPIVETWLSVQNDASHGLGVPLPNGIIKVFQKSVSDSLIYLGENKTPFIPVGKELSLRVGSTREITADMSQTDFRRLGSQVVEKGYRLDLKNESKLPKEVTVFQNVTGDWSVLRETHPHEEEENRLLWTLTLKGQEEVSLRYRIRMNVK